jgi:hypothetical protein
VGAAEVFEDDETPILRGLGIRRKKHDSWGNHEPVFVGCVSRLQSMSVEELKMPINDGAGGADREEYAFIFGNCEEFRQLFNDSLTYLFQGER